jgi:hypothetical protein
MVSVITVRGQESACPALWPHARDRNIPRWLATEKLDELGNDLTGRLFHEPVSGIPDDDVFNVCRDQPALLNQDITGSLLPRKNKHRHGRMRRWLKPE